MQVNHCKIRSKHKTNNTNKCSYYVLKNKQIFAFFNQNQDTLKQPNTTGRDFNLGATLYLGFVRFFQKTKIQPTQKTNTCSHKTRTKTEQKAKICSYNLTKKGE